MDPFFRLHDQLPREGPGDRGSLDRALDLVGLRPDAVIYDVGCGPGGDVAGLLAHVPRGRVVAIDLHAPFIDQLRARFADEPRVEGRVGSMADLEGPIDLVWCAGALYFFGTVAGLRAFRGALAPGGAVVFSAPCWFVDEPSDTARAFWDGEDADVVGREALLAQVREAGFEPVADWPLPDEGWEAYYGPMEARIASLRPGASPELDEVLDAGEREIAGWRAARRETGYLVVVARIT